MELLTRDGSHIEYRTAGPSGYLPFGNSVPPSNDQLGYPVGGVAVTEKTALQVSAVFGSVRVLAGSTSTLPVHEYRGIGAVTDRRVPITSVDPLVDEPFSEIDLLDFITQFVVALALRGNFYGLIVSRDSDLYPTQIMPMNPGHVVVRRLDYGPNKGQLEYRFNGDVVPLSDVVHVRNISASGHIEGLNPIEYCRNSFGFAHASDRWGATFMANSAMPLGVIEVETALSPQETVDMANAWKQAHQGLSQANLPAILTEGAKFNPIQVKPEDAQFLQSKQYTAGEISGMIFGIPPHMIGIVDRTTSWGVGIEQQEMGFVRNTLASYIVRYERMISKLLRPGRYVRLDLGERLRGDTLTRFQAWALALGAGWLNKDEVRAEERRPPIPDGLGQKYYEPVTMAPLGQMGVGGPVSGAGPGGQSLLPSLMAPDAGAQKAPSGQ